MSLSHDCLHFELIGCCTGCRHKQVVVGNHFYYQTNGSLSPVQSSTILQYATYRATATLTIKKFFDLQERHDNMEINTNKNFFSENYTMDILMFISVIISLLATTLTVYLLCQHKKCLCYAIIEAHINVLCPNQSSH